jgi:hypothetical protein
MYFYLQQININKTEVCKVTNKSSGCGLVNTFLHLFIRNVSGLLLLQTNLIYVACNLGSAEPNCNDGRGAEYFEERNEENKSSQYRMLIPTEKYTVQIWATRLKFKIVLLRGIALPQFVTSKHLLTLEITCLICPRYTHYSETLYFNDKSCSNGRWHDCRLHGT